MIEQYDKRTVRISHDNSWYYLDIPEGHNLPVIERAFLRGLEEGKKK